MSFLTPLTFVTCWVLSFCYAATASTNVTIGTKGNGIEYDGDWLMAPVTTAYDGTLAFTNDINAEIDIVLPDNTTDMYYSGFKRTGGAFYAVCVDCAATATSIHFLVDGHDPLADENLPVVLFSVYNLDPTISHTMTVYNLPDYRNDDQSQLTFDSLLVTITSDTGGGDGISGAIPVEPQPSQPFPSSTTRQATRDALPTSSRPASFTRPDSPNFTPSVSGFAASMSNSRPRPSTVRLSTVSPVSTVGTTGLVSSSTSSLPLQALPTSSLASISVSSSPESSSSVSSSAQQTSLSRLDIALIVTLPLAALVSLIVALFILRLRRKRAMSSQWDPGPAPDEEVILSKPQWPPVMRTASANSSMTSLQFLATVPPSPHVQTIVGETTPTTSQTSLPFLATAPSQARTYSRSFSGMHSGSEVREDRGLPGVPPRLRVTFLDTPNPREAIALTNSSESLSLTPPAWKRNINQPWLARKLPRS